jgi:hypothetical protein
MRSSLLSRIAAIWIISPFAVLACFNYPSSDEYYDWMLLEKYGAFEASWHYYLNWSGRYFTHITAFLLNPLHLGERLGGSISAFLGIAFLVIDAWLVSKIFKAIFKIECDVQPIFILFLLLFFCYIPFPNETIFWFTGMIAYMPGFTACLYWVLLNVTENRNRIKQILWFILPVYAGGSGEIGLLVMAWLLTLNFKFEKNFIKKYAPIYALFILAAGTELLSPGSAERMKFFTETVGNPTQNFGFAISKSLNWTWHYLRDWTRSTPVLFIAFVLALLPRSNPPTKCTKPSMVLWSLGIFVPVAMFFVFHFGTGQTQPPGRIINLAFLFLQPFILFTVYSLVKQISNTPVLTSNRIIWIGIVLFIFQASYTSRWRGAVNDFQSLAEYNKEVNHRFELTKAHRQAHPDSTLIVPTINSIPYTAFFSDLNSDTGHWYNEGYAYYHHIKAISCIDTK